MANLLYPLGKQALLEDEVDMLSDDIVVAMVDLDDYTYSEAHQYLSSVPGEAIVATSSPLTNKSTTNGVFDADDVTISGVTGDPAEALIIYQDTGNPNTSRLLVYIDMATGLPFTPNGSDVVITWNNLGLFSV